MSFLKCKNLQYWFLKVNMIAYLYLGYLKEWKVYAMEQTLKIGLRWNDFSKGCVSMFLRASTKSVLEKSLGVTAKELAKMDYDQEISFVKSKTGKKPFFF